MTENEMREFTEKWVEVWNGKDAEQIRAFYTEDAILYQGTVKKTLTGIDNLVARKRDFDLMSSDTVMTARKIHIDGDTIILEINIVGANDGKFLNFEPTGNKIDIDTCLVFELKDGLIAKHTTYLDTATILRQLMIIEVPGTKAEAA